MPRSFPRVSVPIAFGSVRVRAPLAFAGERIGLLGGSFNPAHEGHVRVSQFALKRLGLARVWWLVSPGNPLKSHAELVGQAQRLARAREVANDRRIVVTGLEEGLPTTYTAATVAFLKRRFPATSFVWIMGADSLATLDRWWNWRALLATMPVAVIDRPGWRLVGMAGKPARRSARSFVAEGQARDLARKRPPAWTFLTVPLSAHSSTALRERAKRT